MQQILPDTASLLTTIIGGEDALAEFDVADFSA